LSIEKENIKISAVIPVYNADISELINELADIENISEIIVVDDCSDSNIGIPSNIKKVRSIKMHERSGPAAARNRGTKEAVEDIILFADSDVRLTDSIARELKDLEFPDDIIGISADYTEPEKQKNLFIYYRWIWNYCYESVMSSGSRRSDYMKTAFVLVKKDVLLEMGGFNERYKGADVEDYDLSFRIRERFGKGRFLLSNTLRIKHEFPGLVNGVKDYYKRSRMFTALMFQIKSIEHSGTDNVEFLRRIASFALTIGLVALLPLKIYPPVIALGILFIFLNRKLLSTTIKVEPYMIVPSVIFFMVETIAIFAGSLAGIITVLLRGENSI